MAGHIGSSESLEWGTPPELFGLVKKVFEGRPTLDPAWNPTSIVEADHKYQLPEDDGLTDPWELGNDGPTTVFVNPPFGRSYMKPDRSQIIGAKAFLNLKKTNPEEAATFTVRTSVKDWMKRAEREWLAEHYVETIMLIPASTDTSGWHEHVFNSARAMCFLRGRVRFMMPDGKPGGPSPMPCALVLWGSTATANRFEDVFERVGATFLMSRGNHK